MAGWDDQIFGNLPGSPRRPKLPANTPLFPVNPAAVVGGLMDQGAEAAGRAASYAAGHGPLDALAPSAAPPASAQNSADMFGRDVTAMLQSPTHGGFNPDTALHATLAAAPLAVAAKTGRTAEEIATGAAKGGITAYHGSPHSFDQFDISKIGTGEGAQAYGHGLYFAGNEDVARNYRNQLAPGFVNADGSPLSDAAYSALAFVQPKYEQSGQLAEGIQDAIGRLKNQSDFYRKQYGAGVNLYDNAVDTLQNLDPSTLKPKGHMYQVNINANPDHFLDWDKPLSEQHPNVQRALSDMFGLPDGFLPDGAGGWVGTGSVKGRDVYNTIGRQAVNGDWGPPGDFAQKQAAQQLRDAGIPGIKYLDQGSRGAGSEGGTQNYVTFSDDMIDILKKYGLTGLGLTAGAGALSASGQSPVSSPASAAPPPPGMTLNTPPNWGAQ